MGDATNLVIVLAGEMLKMAEGLIRIGLHPSEIANGYEKACEFALKTLEGSLSTRQGIAPVYCFGSNALPDQSSLSTKSKTSAP